MSSQLSEDERHTALEAVCDDDGLIACTALEIVPPEEGELPPVFVLREAPDIGRLYLAPENATLFDVLQSDPALWSAASLLVSTSQRRIKRLRVVGPPFIEAVGEALARGRASLRFTPERQTMMAEHALTADLVVVLSRFRDHGGPRQLQVQCWLCIGEGETFFVHAQSSNEMKTLSHFDGAWMWLSDEDRHGLVFGFVEPKGARYRKQFRVAAAPPLEYTTALRVVQAFFPVEELSDEIIAEWGDLGPV